MKAVLKTILVVDDDPKAELLYEQELGDAGYRVLRALNGPEALQSLEEQLPDLVVLDLNMPGMNGLEVLSRMRAKYPRLRVILHSAFGAYKDEFISWAADAYVVKSSNLSELKLRILEVLAVPTASTKTQDLLEQQANTIFPVRKILCPLDFSQPSLAALKAAGEWAAHYGAALLVLHVEPYSSPSPTDIVAAAFNTLETDQERCDKAKRSIQEALNQCVPPSVETQGMVKMGNAAHIITLAATEENADLIVMATHGHTGWRHLVLGSVAEKVVQTASCPVLTIHGPAKEKNPGISQLEVQEVAAATA